MCTVSSAILASFPSQAASRQETTSSTAPGWQEDLDLLNLTADPLQAYGPTFYRHGPSLPNAPSLRLMKLHAFNFMDARLALFLLLHQVHSSHFVNKHLLLRPPYEYLTQTSSQGHLQRASSSLICTSKTLTGSGLQLSYLPAALVPRHLTLSFDRSAACLHVSSRSHQATFGRWTNTILRCANTLPTGAFRATLTSYRTLFPPRPISSELYRWYSLSPIQFAPNSARRTPTAKLAFPLLLSPFSKSSPPTRKRLADTSPRPYHAVQKWPAGDLTHPCLALSGEGGNPDVPPFSEPFKNLLRISCRSLADCYRLSSNPQALVSKYQNSVPFCQPRSVQIKSTGRCQHKRLRQFMAINAFYHRGLFSLNSDVKQAKNYPNHSDAPATTSPKPFPTAFRRRYKDSSRRNPTFMELASTTVTLIVERRSTANAPRWTARQSRWAPPLLPTLNAMLSLLIIACCTRLDRRSMPSILWPISHSIELPRSCGRTFTFILQPMGQEQGILAHIRSTLSSQDLIWQSEDKHKRLFGLGNQTLKSFSVFPLDINSGFVTSFGLMVTYGYKDLLNPSTQWRANVNTYLNGEESMAGRYNYDWGMIQVAIQGRPASTRGGPQPSPTQPSPEAVSDRSNRSFASKADSETHLLHLSLGIFPPLGSYDDESSLPINFISKAFGYEGKSQALLLYLVEVAGIHNQAIVSSHEKLGLWEFSQTRGLSFDTADDRIHVLICQLVIALLDACFSVWSIGRLPPIKAAFGLFESTTYACTHETSSTNSALWSSNLGGCSGGAQLACSRALPQNPLELTGLVDSCRLGASRGPGQHEQHCSAASAAAAVCVAPAPIYPSLQPFSRGLCPIARRSPHLYLMQGTDTLICSQAISSRTRDERAKIAGWMSTATILRNRPFLASHIADSDPGPLAAADPPPTSTSRPAVANKNRDLREEGEIKETARHGRPPSPLFYFRSTEENQVRGCCHSAGHVSRRGIAVKCIAPVGSAESVSRQASALSADVALDPGSPPSGSPTHPPAIPHPSSAFHPMPCRRSEAEDEFLSLSLFHHLFLSHSHAEQSSASWPRGYTPGTDTCVEPSCRKKNMQPTLLLGGICGRRTRGPRLCRFAHDLGSVTYSPIELLLLGELQMVARVGAATRKRTAQDDGGAVHARTSARLARLANEKEATLLRGTAGLSCQARAARQPAFSARRLRGEDGNHGSLELLWTGWAVKCLGSVGFWLHYRTVESGP
ncbi:uncharacterized protein CLUP02_03731 [Colletotrichum lupini]|uniref:Uncharacterized protein n=1 Tax=Colletotrichum lupini TaxID=145971 RepID=A0A9Q8SJ40_9PEZI|nr:uncharacterized protein CLUP02_03731 [Colletotrichum lupini]UQC78254.1 hypothetical protein CLUP02_03731 [Colletotrichum lupini]